MESKVEDKQKEVQEINEKEKIERISKSISSVLTTIGEDVNREGLLKTPERVAKALLFFVHGEHMKPEGKKKKNMKKKKKIINKKKKNFFFEQK